MIRNALGEDAIIVATHEEKNAVGGKAVRVTAAVERQSDYDTAEETSSDWLYGDDNDEAMVIEEITEAMLRHAVPEDVLDQIISCASILGIDESRLALLSAIESLFKFSPLSAITKSRPVMMIGAPGAGKTLATAKIAARSSMNGLNVAVITTDTERAGGREQLEAFTKLMDIDLKIAKTPTALKEILLETKNADQVIIDTAGVNPFEIESLKPLARMIGAAEITPVLVLPAGTDAEEAGEMAQIFATIGAERLLPTRVDVARRLGSLLSAAYQGGLDFAEISSTAKVADGLSRLTSKRLTQLLMPTSINAKMKKDHESMKKAG